MEEDPALLRAFRGHRGGVTSVAFCGGGARPGAAAAAPGEPRLVTGSLDGTVMIWHAQQHVRAFRYIGHGDAVNSVAYDATHNLVASASNDKTVRRAGRCGAASIRRGAPCWVLKAYLLNPMLLTCPALLLAGAAMAADSGGPLHGAQGAHCRRAVLRLCSRRPPAGHRQR